MINDAALPVFTADIGMLRLSPSGLVQCAADWIRSAIIPGDRYEKNSPAVAAALGALRSAPDVFVSGQPNQDVFWTSFFHARRRSAIVEPLESLLVSLDKSALASCGKDLLILAARSKDVESFKFLLGLGVVRRSKLVLFSGYKHGGRAIAASVKKPTANEASELVRDFAAHSTDDLLWLLGHCGDTSFKLERLATIAACSPDKKIASAILAASSGSFSSTPIEHSYIGRVQQNFSARDVAIRCSMNFASCRDPEATRTTSRSLLAMPGGGDPWLEFCRDGVFINGRSVIARPDRTPHSTYQIPLCPHADSPKITSQAACLLAGDAESAMWLRSEYASMGVSWLSSSDLAAMYASAKIAARSDVEMFNNALALSEKVDFEFGIQSAPEEPARRRPRSL